MENQEPWVFRLTGRRQESRTVHTFAFEPSRPVPFRAGQWIHLACAAEVTEKSQVRHMSIASAPGDGALEFTMDLGSGSDYKKAMGLLKVGDEVKAFKLKGEFTVGPEDRAPIVFLAGGLGITPIRSLIRDLSATLSPVPWTLVHVSRDEFLFERELSAFGSQQWRTDHRGLDALWPEIVGFGAGSARYYLCGSERFVTGIQERLGVSGVGPERIRTENFH